MNVQYLLDENLAPIYREQLLRRQFDLVVWMVGDPYAPAKGTQDPEILFWCEKNSCLLVTNNRRSMPVHLADHLTQGRHVPGILVLRPRAEIGQVVDDLLAIAGASLKDEYRVESSTFR
ncbi:MAG: DUF5615 family PIN-like protein [Cyanobacteria bacterium CRU_2_1]|nr:DUF5615 family PIN-like protein [Cyanobacteria bacterium CRU_2_1]